MLKYTKFVLIACFCLSAKVTAEDIESSPLCHADSFQTCHPGKGVAEDAKSYQLEAISNGDYKEAEKQLLAVLETKPNDPFALLNLAFIYQKYGENEKAKLMYDRIMAQRDNPHAQLASGKPRRVKSIARKGIALLEE